MIKVVYLYKTKTANLEKLFEKFQKSADPKFHLDKDNLGIEMFRRDENDDTYISLEIYYESREHYKEAIDYETSFTEWQEMWFSKNIQHEEISVDVYEVLKK